MRLARKHRASEKRAASIAACVGAAVVALPILAVTGTANAQPITFAQFSEADNLANPNLFAYVDNGPGGDAELITSNNGTSNDPTVASIPVVFNYQSISPYLPADLQGNQDATLTLTCSTKDDVFSAGADVDAQEFEAGGETDDVLTITRDTPAAEGGGTRTNLLTMYFYPAVLTGFSYYGGTETPQLFGGETIGSYIYYSSDFLNFGAGSVVDSDFSMTFSSWTSYDGNGLEFSPVDGYFAEATAAGTGTFDTSPEYISVPEPASLGMLATGMLLMARRRKRSRA